MSRIFIVLALVLVLASTFGTSQRISCYNKHTSYNDGANRYIVYLDRHNIACPHNQLLGRIQLQRFHNWVRYVYRCCSIKFHG